MTVEKYATKDDIIFFVRMFDTEFNEEKIDDRFLKIANARVDAWIIEKGLQPKNTNISDSFNLLWSACICFALELLCYTGVVQWSTGDVALQRLNRVTYQFQRWQPMFFFASGSSDPFKGLLPHETYRMMAYAYVEAYCRKDFFNKNGSVYPIPKVSFDNTTRGYRWNADNSSRIVDDFDSKYGVSGYTQYEFYDDGPV